MIKLEPRAPGRPRAASRTPQDAPTAPARSLADDHPIALLQTNSLPALVQRELERMILAGDLAAGAPLRETEVAAMLGVSRGPVREAFRALEESGLVRLEKNRGVHVRQIPVAEADELYELRAVLENFIGRRVAQRATPEVVRELTAQVERMERAAAQRDVDGYYQENLAFHDRLAQLAGNAKLLTMYRRLVNELNLFRHATLAQVGTLPASTREHREIVKRIAAGDAAAAGRTLQEHVQASQERMHRMHVAHAELERRATKAVAAARKAR
jgi:phosphonate utilization transcriptional regulator